MLTSLAGLAFSASQSRHAAHSTAIATVQHFMIESHKLWDECDAAIAAQPPKLDRLRAVVGRIMGHFEVIVTLLADGAVQGKLQRLVAGTVRDYLDHMSQKGFSPYVQSGLDTDEVCENLKKFCLQRRVEFRNPESVFAMLKIPKSSL